MTKDQLDKAMSVARQLDRHGKDIATTARLAKQVDEYNKAIAAAARAQAVLEKATAKHLEALRDRDKALHFAHEHGATVRRLAEVINKSPAAVSKAVRRTP